MARYLTADHKFKRPISQQSPTEQPVSQSNESTRESRRKACHLHRPFLPSYSCDLQQQRRHGGQTRGPVPLAKHDETDDFFLVLKGTLEIELRDRTVTINSGEVFVVPRGVEHRPVARGEVHILLN